MTIVIENCAIATVDATGTEHASGHIVIDDGRITAVGEGSGPNGDTRIDGSGCLATPGLVNCHHHLYQSATRGLAQDGTLFEWLAALYPVWAHVDADRVAVARGCATLADRRDAVALDDDVPVAVLGAGGVDRRDRAVLDDDRHDAARRTASRIFS